MYQGIAYGVILLIVVAVGFWLYRQGGKGEENKTLKAIDKVQDDQLKEATKRNDTASTIDSLKKHEF